MSKRNLIWLIVVVAVGVIVGVLTAWWAGLIAAAIVLAISEIVERAARRRRLAGD